MCHFVSHLPPISQQNKGSSHQVSQFLRGIAYIATVGMSGVRKGPMLSGERVARIAWDDNRPGNAYFLGCSRLEILPGPARSGRAPNSDSSAAARATVAGFRLAPCGGPQTKEESVFNRQAGDQHSRVGPEGAQCVWPWRKLIQQEPH